MTIAETLDTDIITFLQRHENKELMRFVAAGSVDDGKSTLIGRLLHDTGSVYEDQLRDATREGQVDLARITDGLRAEREQGITIDVAYRYFTTARRKFIIADTPGHIQYTRNMATGASTANLAIILLDARLGVLPQSRRHAFIASLLGIPRLIVAVNKMDLVAFDQARFDELRTEFAQVIAPLGFRDAAFIPISALLGDNVVSRSESAPWYTGPTVLEYLETVELTGDRNLEDFRLPVQYVLRPNLNYRGFAGQIASGIVRVGDPIVVLPSGKTSTVRAIDTYEGELTEAFAPQGVVLRLSDEVDVSRGDILALPDNRPRVARSVRADIVWMDEQPLDLNRSWLIKHGARYVRVNFDAIEHRTNLQTMQQEDAAQLDLNDIGLVRLTAHRPLVFDGYRRNRATGAFIVIDPMTNATVGAGMIRDDAADVPQQEDTDPWTGVGIRERQQRLGHPAALVAVSGDADLARLLGRAIERRLFDRGVVAAVISADDPSIVDATAAYAHAKRLVDAGLVAVLVHDAAASAVVSDGSRVFQIRATTTPDEAPNAVAVSVANPERSADAFLAVLAQAGVVPAIGG